MVEKNMPACKKWELYVKGELFYDEISICLKIVKTLTSGKKKGVRVWSKKTAQAQISMNYTQLWLQ